MCYFFGKNKFDRLIAMNHKSDAKYLLEMQPCFRMHFIELSYPLLINYIVMKYSHNTDHFRYLELEFRRSATGLQMKLGTVGTQYESAQRWRVQPTSSVKS